MGSAEFIGFHHKFLGQTKRKTHSVLFGVMTVWAPQPDESAHPALDFCANNRLDEKEKANRVMSVGLADVTARS